MSDFPSDVPLSPWQQASAPKIGDERIAFAGHVPVPDDPSSSFGFGVFAWRVGNVIVIMFAGGIGDNQLSEIFTIGRDIVGHVPVPQDAATTPAPGDVHTGGIWDVLPTLDDLPEGFVFVEDRPQGEASSALGTPAP